MHCDVALQREGSLFFIGSRGVPRIFERVWTETTSQGTFYKPRRHTGANSRKRAHISNSWARRSTWPDQPPSFHLQIEGAVGRNNAGLGTTNTAFTPIDLQSACAPLERCNDSILLWRRLSREKGDYARGTIP